MEKRVLIIAEAGVNHNGDYGMAIKLCDEAKRIGADVVKFQTFKTERIVTKQAALAAYQQESDPALANQFELLKGLELSYADFRGLKAHCDQLGIEFLSTPDEEESLEFLLGLGLRRLKIGSGEATNVPFLRKVARSNLPLIVSTGMCTMEEVGFLCDTLLSAGAKREDLCLLHCNSGYPTPMEDANIAALTTLRSEFGTEVGYSDHTMGIHAPLAAVALGATVIEKHFTLDTTLPGPDQSLSLEPSGFAQMVNCIRDLERAIGNGKKIPSPSEVANRDIVRKFVVAETSIAVGDTFSERNLTTKRTGGGVSAREWDQVIGKRARNSYQQDDRILGDELN